jgi:hypothetical protein
VTRQACGSEACRRLWLARSTAHAARRARAARLTPQSRDASSLRRRRSDVPAGASAGHPTGARLVPGVPATVACRSAGDQYRPPRRVFDVPARKSLRALRCAERPSLPRDTSTTETATPLSPSPARARGAGYGAAPPAPTVAARLRSDGPRPAPDPGVSAAPRQGTQTGRHTPPARPGAPRTTCPSPEHSTPPGTADTSKETGPNRGPAHPHKPEESLKFAGIAPGG